eukprot:TRINITY_DN64830_c0_g1_i2.p1 TRINITY_DN64830_c0_g1~~TRINITY_DN64830_c0_g1_i2.p1  ORF type:complete len:235 (+),score=22.17 TRINITY_DN64830_c0_g1_i2:84-788(+)
MPRYPSRSSSRGDRQPNRRRRSCSRSRSPRRDAGRRGRGDSRRERSPPRRGDSRRRSDRSPSSARGGGGRGGGGRGGRACRNEATARSRSNRRSCSRSRGRRAASPPPQELATRHQSRSPSRRPAATSKSRSKSPVHPHARSLLLDADGRHGSMGPSEVEGPDKRGCYRAICDFPRNAGGKLMKNVGPWKESKEAAQKDVDEMQGAFSSGGMPAVMKWKVDQHRRFIGTPQSRR